MLGVQVHRGLRLHSDGADQLVRATVTATDACSMVGTVNLSTLLAVIIVGPKPLVVHGIMPRDGGGHAAQPGRLIRWVHMQEFHRAVADEVQDTMRGGPRGDYGRPGGMPYRDTRHMGMGDRHAGDRGGRVLPPPLPQDPATNPRGIEAIVKLRGLPFDAAPRDVTDWINGAVHKKECFLSQPVCALLHG